MPTGDLSPSLPQPGDDNAPMISGRGTKIIADARGAYLAGNLRALIEAMTDEQTISFRSALISQARYYLERNLPDEYFPILELISSQANHSQEVANLFDAVLAQLRSIHAIELEGIPDNYSHFELVDPRADCIIQLVSAVLHGDLESLAGTVQSVLWTILWYERESQMRASAEVEERSSARSWQIETAWAILQHRNLPLLDTFIEIQPAHIRAYRQRNLDALSRLLNQDQKYSLCTLFIRQTLFCAHRMTHTDPDLTVIDILLNLRKQWESDIKRIGLANAQIRVLNGVDSLQKQTNLNLRTHELTLMLSSNDPARIASSSINALRELLPSDEAYQPSPIIQSLSWWQVEAAWAMLHLYLIPPFPELPE